MTPVRQDTDLARSAGHNYYELVTVPEWSNNRGATLKVHLAIAVFAVLLFVVTACSTSTTPSSCVDLAREKGVPETIIKAIERPEELDAMQRIAVRKALEAAGLREACAGVLK